MLNLTWLGVTTMSSPSIQSRINASVAALRELKATMPSFPSQSSKSCIALNRLHYSSFTNLQLFNVGNLGDRRTADVSG